MGTELKGAAMGIQKGSSSAAFREKLGGYLTSPINWEGQGYSMNDLLES